ncbi:AAA family ATPase [Neobacillus sp. MM2021_6]|uniref:AAA family ATPase n=1 Tax=Bacillaceae TaxID=186817 RepID=UPI0014084781|nr:MULTISPECIES: AAA family ATPase [Bacillaceae]MBO0962843.1 AAA family ATPase [Neobacillus sp. MM2021_6]NHC21448.1 AAA domain-containing protein [Bacillus sp. MM2020_4]
MKLETLLEKGFQYSTDRQMVEEKENGRLSFIKRFPLESLPTLSVEEYADTKTKDCFIYWLERKHILAGIGGGNSAKFGVYRAQNGEYCKGYGTHKTVLEGEKLQDEFKSLKEGIVQAILLAQEDRIAEIGKLELPLFNMVLLKILNIYVPEKFFNVYSPPILLELGKELEINNELLLPQNSIEVNHKVLNGLKGQEGFSDWKNQEIAFFIWDTFAERDKKLVDDVRFWLVGHTYGDEGSILEFLLQQNTIAIGFLREDLSSYLNEGTIDEMIEEKEKSTAGQKALKQFFSLKEGDFVALKSTFTRKINGKTKSVLRIHAVGKIAADPVDGYHFSDEYGHLLPVKWLNTEEHEHIGYGGYRSTINEVKNKSAIHMVFMQGEGGHDEPMIAESYEDNFPMNTVLYGPPGTGKTYHVVDHALKIINHSTFNELEVSGREALQQEFSRLIRDGKIHFITFHQSYAYEDFIEGLKSDGKGNFVPTDGVFKRAAYEATYEGIQNNTQEFSEEVRFEQLYDHLVANGINQLVEFESKTGGKLIISHISANDHLVITSEDAKTSSIVSKERLLRVFRYIRNHHIDWKNNVSFIHDAIGGSNQTRYWSVLNWILTKMEEDVEEDRIEIEGDEKKAIVLKALNGTKSFDFTNAQRHVVIIDEMNRGNISKIFGELLTLLEDDKRLTKNNELIVELPYSKEKFTLPPNLYVIGTMNTADRSIALLDTALRRRFVFEEMMPTPEHLESIGDEIDLVEMVTKMNKRIEVLYDRDHMIGHAYFINAKTDQEIVSIVESKIIPLLQEYFYDDWEKIGLVLGGIGTSEEDSYIVYKEEINVNDLFKQRPSLPIPALYRVKRKLTTQELIAIYE